MKLALTVAGAKLTADGAFTQPLQGKGYDLAVSGTVPDAAALTPLLQGFIPPPLHDVSFTAKVADTGGKLPDVSTLTLHVGASDLNAQVPGLSLDKLDIDAPKVDQPMKIDGAAKLGDTPLTVAGTLRTRRRCCCPTPSRRRSRSTSPSRRTGRPPRRKARSRTPAR